MGQDCASWRTDLGAYVIGALDADESIAMRRHLAACPACRADYEDLLPIGKWLASTKRHLAACPACRADYENFLHGSFTATFATTTEFAVPRVPPSAN